MKSFSLTYASSLFSLAEDENLTEKIFEELTCLSEIFQSNPDYAILLDSPTLSLSQRLGLIDEAFADCSQYVLNFIKILCEKKCVHLFLSCVKEYKKLYYKANNIENVTAITAVPLSSSLRDKLINKLEKESGKKIQLAEMVDKSILGGIVLRTENSQTDASLRTRLDSIRAQLSSAES